jgi:hypothetical protein
MKLSVLAYNNFPVFVLDIFKDDGTIRSQQIIFPKEIFYDLYEENLMVKSDAGVIPFSDLRIPNATDSWIWDSFSRDTFQIIDFDSRIYFKFGA